MLKKLLSYPISSGAKTLYFYFYAFADADGICRVKREDICADLSIRETAFQSYMNALEDGGFAKRIRSDGDKRRYMYEVVL